MLGSRISAKQVLAVGVIAPLAIVLIAILVISALVQEVTQSALREKLIEVERRIDVTIDDLNWEAESWYHYDEYSYRDRISRAITAVDLNYRTFASAYTVATEDDITAAYTQPADYLVTAADNVIYAQVSVRDHATSFEPLHDIEMMNAANSEESGTLTLQYGDTSTGEPIRTMNMYYRWVDDPEDTTHPYLIVIGVSQYTIESEPNKLMNVLIGIFFAVIVASCGIQFYIILQYVYNSKTKQGAVTSPTEDFVRSLR